MKKILALLFFACLVTTSWAAATDYEASVRNTAVPVEIRANGLPLGDLLQLLAAESGVTMAAVPDVADRKIDLSFRAQQPLGEILDILAQQYHLVYKFNQKQQAVIVLPAPYSAQYLIASGPMIKSGQTEAFNGTHPVPAPGGYVGPGYFNTEEYKRIYDNGYQEAIRAPLSTFSIDVDTASYSNIRRFINRGQLPPPDAVRTEELLNYFSYSYPQPADGHPFSVTAEVSACPWQPGHQLVHIGLQGKNIPKEQLPPGNLVFLIDVSGSMADDSKLPLLKSAFKLLVKELRHTDTVSIVTYAGRAGVILGPTKGSDKAAILAAIDGLQAGGSTAGGAGIQLAYSLAKKNFLPDGNNRVILATDGDFNVGVSSEGDLVRLIEVKRQEGIYLSVIGVGQGNLKDNKMEQLADKGNGNYAYIDTLQEAKRVFVSQMAGTLFTIAKDVKLQVEFNPSKVKEYRLIGYENRSLANRDFSDDSKDAGEMGAGQSVTALYEIIPTDAEGTSGAADPLAYQQVQLKESDDLLQVKIRYKQPSEDSSILLVKKINSRSVADTPSADFRFAAAVAEYGMLLRFSEYRGQASYRQVLTEARQAMGKDADGYRSEFIRLVEISELLDDR